MFHPNLTAPLTALLKAKTAQTHAALEEELLPHLHGIRSVKDYSKILKVFYGFFKPLEMAIEPFLGTHQLRDWHLRRKANFIQQDLAYLEEARGPFPFATDLPSINNTASAFGALYVLEGSTLGGRHITRMIQQSLPEAAGGIQFFSGYGEATSTMWKTFQGALNSFAADNVTQEIVIAAADETFIKFGLWIQQTK
jgi:heme oxygenase